MIRHVFFSFHYQQDICRVSQVRERWRLRGQTNIFLDPLSWEAVKRQGPMTIKSWIARQMDGTSVTVVLIGEHTARRRYVKFEIERSISEGKGILGIYIDGIRDGDGHLSARGRNPLESLSGSIPRQPLSLFRTYDWVRDDGPANMVDWIEEAARGKELGAPW